MSVQRSPPGPLSLLSPAKTNTIHYNSDSALNMATTSAQDENYFNITKRHKRCFDDSVDLAATSNREVLELQSLSDSRFEILNSSLLTIMAQNQAIQKSIESMSIKHEQLLLKVNTLEKENCEQRTRMLALENKIDMLERSNRSTSLEIRNLPKQKVENKGILRSIIKSLSSALDTDKPIEESEIRDVYRNQSETIVVDFTTTSRKEDLISNYRNFNKTKRQNKERLFNSEHLKLPGTPHPIFISESLTSKARHLFYLARGNVKAKNLVSAWTSFGKVYVRKEEDSPPVRINEEGELLKLAM
ncbi:hypothetical protein ABMA28_001868 [Loxostege sticticalis]|uniref:FP protein C-terminal domain-containing protein n=1 Tax=Loxostege sticticalis TaxID=481309 RepID=A0ABD0T378_LOXSC